MADVSGGPAPSGPSGGNFASTMTNGSVSQTNHSSTNFVDDKQTVTVSIANPLGVNKLIGESNVQVTSLAAFLAKPVRVSSITWDTTDTATQILAAFNIGAQLTAVAIWGRKIEGFRYMRADCCIRIQLNANPMQQGRLIAHFLPFHSNAINPGEYEDLHITTLNGITQSPNMEIDCRQTAAEMVIPYVAPTQWYDIEDNEIDWGRFYLTVLSPLATGATGKQTVSVQIWVSFENAEFMGPTEPQMAFDSKGNATGSSSLGDARKTPEYHRQNVRSSSDPAAVEVKGMEQGPITKALGRLSAIAFGFSAIPQLTAFAAPVAWVTAVGAGIASVFGWSKPNIDEIAKPYFIRPTRNFGNAQGQTYAETLAIVSDPRVSVLPGFAGTDNDEMAFNFLKRKPAFVDSFEITTSNTVGTVYYTAGVGPSIALEVETVVTPSTLIPPVTGYTNVIHHYVPFAYVAKVFQYWRGSINYHFKFIKTGYHSARLSLDFVPGDNAGTITQNSYNLREIIDISESNEYIFNVPYMLNYPWAQWSQQMGLIELALVSELTAPDSVADTIEVLVYMSAGDDFEVCSNVPTNTFPTMPEMDTTSAIAANKPIGNSKPSGKAPLILGQYTTGDNFNSIKQLITRYSKLFLFRTTTGTQVLWPYTMGIASGTKLSPTPIMYRSLSDWLSYFAPGYALARGGMRFYISARNATDTTLLKYPVYANTVFSGSNATADTTPLNTEGASTALFQPLTTLTTSNPALFLTEQDGIEIIVPYHNATPSTIMCSYGNNGGSAGVRPTDQSQPDVFLQVQNLPSLGSSETYTDFYRAANEDFQFGYFIGFPGLLYTHTVTPL